MYDTISQMSYGNKDRAMDKLLVKICCEIKSSGDFFLKGGADYKFIMPIFEEFIEDYEDNLFERRRVLNLEYSFRCNKLKELKKLREERDLYFSLIKDIASDYFEKLPSTLNDREELSIYLNEYYRTERDFMLSFKE